ncbi:MAG: accessory factor UbiK family protein [Gammaproteobacteria bacterium]|nr:accessory factor UbiK family protein [Gammaproteobacteria bacterium]
MNDIPASPGDIIERIMQTAKAALPESVSNDVKDNIRAAIQEVINDLDVVTRDELDVQKEVLQKTRAKVDEMEAIIADLEQKLEQKLERKSKL